MTAADVLRSLRLLSHRAMFRSRPKHRFLSCKDPYKHFNLSFPNEFLLIKYWQFQAKFLWFPSPTQKCLGFPYSESTGWCKQKATALIQSRLFLSCPSPGHPKSVVLPKARCFVGLARMHKLHWNIQSLPTSDKICAFQISQPLRIVLHVLDIKDFYFSFPCDFLILYITRTLWTVINKMR